MEKETILKTDTELEVIDNGLLLIKFDDSKMFFINTDDYLKMQFEDFINDAEELRHHDGRYKYNISIKIERENLRKH